MDRASRMVERIRAGYQRDNAPLQSKPQPTPPSGVRTAPLPPERPETSPQISTKQPRYRHHTAQSSGERTKRRGADRSS